MTKPDFLQSPTVWTRAHRTYVDPVRYASPVERFRAKGHGAALWLGVSILCGFGVAFVAGLL